MIDDKHVRARELGPLARLDGAGGIANRPHLGELPQPRDDPPTVDRVCVDDEDVHHPLSVSRGPILVLPPYPRAVREAMIAR